MDHKSKLAGSSRHYGWTRSSPDIRDELYKFIPQRKTLLSLSDTKDLTPQMGPTLDQGNLGSCGPNSEASMIMLCQAVQGMLVDCPSRLFSYYATRLLMGTVAQDSGVDNRTMMKALNQYGFAPERSWAYQVEHFTTKPDQSVFDAAASNKVTAYRSVDQNLDTMLACIDEGHPVLFGFTVYSSFESNAVTQTGMVPMPKRTEQVLGGHDVVLCGFDMRKRLAKFKNSWNGWGENGSGYGWLPFAYLTNPNLSSDFWMVDSIPGTPVPPTPTPLQDRIVLTQNLKAGTYTVSPV